MHHFVIFPVLVLTGGHGTAGGYPPIPADDGDAFADDGDEGFGGGGGGGEPADPSQLAGVDGAGDLPAPSALKVTYNRCPCFIHCIDWRVHDLRSFVWTSRTLARVFLPVSCTPYDSLGVHHSYTCVSLPFPQPALAKEFGREISVFGEYVIRCFHSPQWALREAALKKIDLELPGYSCSKVAWDVAVCGCACAIYEYACCRSRSFWAPPPSCWRSSSTRRRIWGYATHAPVHLAFYDSFEIMRVGVAR